MNAQEEVVNIIKSLQLQHNGGFYLYRVHTKKSSALCANSLGDLNSFLTKVFEACPNHFFQSGPRGSALKFKLPLELIEVTGHEVSNLAKWGLQENSDRFSQAHLQVQTFMLENDSKTIAMEVPIWLEHHELEGFIGVLNTFQPLTGHIDIVRVDNENVWIWDYKPNARKEKYAATQTFFYALMLCKRTGIPLEKFRCGFFDKNYAYLFKPELKYLQRSVQLTAYQSHS